MSTAASSQAATISNVSASGTYVYTRLPENCIRLLRVSTGSNKLGWWTNPQLEIIQCELRPDGTRSPNYQYECLSYAWGTASRDERIDLIAGQGHLAVTKSLKDALKNLCEVTETGFLWIDQICINQEDTRERGQQVGRMYELYSFAHRTVIWLGPSMAWLTMARSLARQSQSKRLTSVVPLWIAFWPLRKLFNRRWFQRGWVCQEFSLSRDVIALVGSTVLREEQLLLLATSTLRILNPGELLADMSVSVSWLPVAQRETKGALAYTMLQTLRQRHTIAKRPRQIQVYTEHEDTLLAYQTALHIMQRCNEHFNVTDPKDRVIAYLGLLPQIEYIPDYTKKTEDVFTNFARRVIERTLSLDILAYASGSSRTALGPNARDLPSWVPHWEWPYYGASLPTWNNRDESPDSVWAPYGSPMLSWNACGPRRLHELVETGECPRHISAMGREICRIRSVSSKGFQPNDFADILLDRPQGSVRRLKDEILPGITAAQGLVLALKCLAKSRYEQYEVDRVENPRSQRRIGSVMVDRPILRVAATKRGILPYSEVWKRLTTLAGKFMFSMDSGSLGIAARPCEPGDVVTILHGCYQPMILRPSASESGCHEVVSGAFVDGIMRGEAVTWAEDDAEQFRLC